MLSLLSSAACTTEAAATTKLKAHAAAIIDIILERFMYLVLSLSKFAE
jgi:hypothetical protein